MSLILSDVLFGSNMLLSFLMPAGMVLEGVVDTTPVVVDVISGAGVVVGDGFLQEKSFMRSKMVQSNIQV